MLDHEKIKSAISNIIDLLRNETSYPINSSGLILSLLFLKWLPNLSIVNGLESEIHRFLDQDNWEELTAVGKEIENIFVSIESDIPGLEKVFTRNNWNKIDEYVLRKSIKEISEFVFIDDPLERSKLLETIYEILLFDSGLYEDNLSTPHDLATLIVNLIKPDLEMELYDPACGSGNILIEMLRYFIEQGKKTNEIHLWGQEKNHELRSIASIVMLLHGVTNFDVSSEDITKENRKSRKFDVIITNPPFGVSNWKGYQDNLLDFQYRKLPSNSADYMFIQLVLCCLKESGRAAMIVPHGVLFRGGAEGIIRKNIVEDNWIRSIISLPQNLFYNTRIPTAIIVFEKTKNNKILFIDASNDHGIMRKRNFLTNENINKICTTYSELLEEVGYSRIVSRDEIISCDYNLIPNLYVKQKKSTSKLDIDLQIKKVQELESQKGEVENKMNIYLNALGIKI